MVLQYLKIWQKDFLFLKFFLTQIAYLIKVNFGKNRSYSTSKILIRTIEQGCTHAHKKITSHTKYKIYQGYIKDWGSMASGQSCHPRICKMLIYFEREIEMNFNFYKSINVYQG